MIANIVNIFMAIVGVAMAAVVVGSPNTANIIKNFGSAFSNSISAAKG
jgi:hypothetical protein